MATAKQGKSTTIQDKAGQCLTEEQEIINRWTEYCSELHNHKTTGDPAVLNCLQTTDEDNLPILHAEVEATVRTLKIGSQLAFLT